ncbi:cytochrome b5 domain-containing protein [Wukongibacter sp. M2B1]|uniref:cytochrome b5 domain-containing protein n=1 Tax=Wukongibacter sp. M2B1 TaxID=3088895 RepID=UPI003D7AE0C4
MKQSSKTKFEIKKSIGRIIWLQKMIYFSPYTFQKLYYNELLKQEIAKVNQLTNTYYKRDIKRESRDIQNEFTIEELARYDGSNGRSAYVAVNGVVYDVSSEATWGGGTHFGIYAGRDVTNEFLRCHGSEEILKNLPRVGVLK